MVITKTANASGARGIKLKISELRNEVYQAVRSILIEKARMSFERASLTPSELARRCGAVGRDGTLDADKFKAVLKESGLELQFNMGNILVGILDPRSAVAGASRKPKITQTAIKAIFEACGSLSGGQSMGKKMQVGAEEEKESYGAGPIGE